MCSHFFACLFYCLFVWGFFCVQFVKSNKVIPPSFPFSSQKLKNFSSCIGPCLQTLLLEMQLLLNEEREWALYFRNCWGRNVHVAHHFKKILHFVGCLKSWWKKDTTKIIFTELAKTMSNRHDFWLYFWLENEIL